MTSFIALFKILLAPFLIGGTSLAGRKWGPAVSGWLVGLPLTTGPVILFLALEQGTSYAALAAAGTFAGGFSLITFALSYSWLAQYLNWLPSVLISTVVFFTLTFVLQQISLASAPLFVMLLVGLVVAMRLMPNLNASAEEPTVPLPNWDLPARMIIATGIVFSLTTFSTLLGARFTGLLATFPAYTAILATFAHHLQGPAAVTRVFRGLLLGLFTFAFFYLILSLGLEPLGVWGAFLLAIAVGAVVQLTSLWVLTKK